MTPFWNLDVPVRLMTDSVDDFCSSSFTTSTAAGDTTLYVSSYSSSFAASADLISTSRAARLDHHHPRIDVVVVGSG